MKLFTFTSIRTRLTFWFLTLSLTPLLVGIMITFSQEKKVIEQETFNKLISIRDLKVHQLENWFDERIGDLLVMSGDYEIRGLERTFGKEVKSPEDLETMASARELLSRNHRSYNDYEEIFIVGANTGLVELSTIMTSVGINKSHNPYFTIPLETDDLFIKDIYYSTTLKRPQMTMSIPIYCLEHGDHIIGILVMRINLEQSLYALLGNRIGLGNTGETLIVNKDCVALNELRYYDDAPLKLPIKAEPAVNASQGETGTLTTTDYRGVDVLAAYTYIPETGWGFVCKQDLIELNAPIRKMVKNFVILLIVSSLIIFLIVFWLIKRISTPIVDLDTATQKIKSGDYSVRTFVDSRDELASLADSINEMTASIETRIMTQKAVTDISETMIGQSSMQGFGSKLLKQLMEITGANMSTFYILNEGTSEYEHFASIGANAELLQSFNAENPEGEFGNVLSDKSIYYLQNIPDDTTFKFKTTAGDAIPKEIITIPVLIESRVVALISLVSMRKFSEECLGILNQSWSAINTSYSNLMSNERTRILAEHLHKTNQQLEAQTEELQDQTEELQQQTEELQDQTEELQHTSEELQEQNLELDAQKQQVEAANKLKSEFLSNMSHELRTPLNSIMALSRVLMTQAKDKLSEEENGYLEIVERNGRRLLSLINDILDLSKIEAGRMDILPEFVSISSLLQIIKENMQTLSEQKGLTLTLSVPDNLPKVESDESKLHQILSNIVGNAVKFTEKGGVDISVNHEKESVIIEVKDSGIGISKEMLPHIFDEFRQADGSSSRLYEGTGLGLAIANKLAQVLGSNIEVISEAGKGSAFTMTIPIKWHEKRSVSENDAYEAISWQAQESTKTDVQDVSEIRILIVEDNLDAIIQVKSVLENENYTVDVAHGGQEALDYIKHTIPDGIILDLMMPDVDGFEVLKNLRSNASTKMIPVLILTAKDLSRKDLSRLSASNIQQLIYKGDVDIDGLLTKVKLMLVQDVKSNVECRKSKVDILIVEDNPDNMTTIQAILKGKYNIAEAVDAEEGLKLARTKIPDLILLDMSLPKMSGEEIITVLKENVDTKDILIIAVTAQAMKGDREKFLKMGCDGYVSKPIDQEALLEEISRLTKV